MTDLRNLKTIEERREHVGKKKNTDLSCLSIFPEDLKEAAEKNCENMIGAVQVPVGIAGPLKLNGRIADGEYYIPLATTEGALVASVNRGCKAVTLSGGTDTYFEYPGITRGAVFKSSGLKQSFEFKRWLENSNKLLSDIAKTTSSHIEVKAPFIKIAGRRVYVRFSFDTKDAMGMNMATVAVHKMAEYIRRSQNIECISLAGNFDNDKKPSFMNSLLGRGHSAWAECLVGREITEDVLKTTPEGIHRVWIDKCMLGSSLSGSIAQNAHFANIIAALYLATGQDIAHISEGSLGVTTTEIIKGGLYISVYLPDLPLGTVGGGTRLPSQSRMLSLLGISGGNDGKNSSAFAEITAGAVLAGELSLLASLSEGSLALSHQRLARGKNQI